MNATGRFQGPTYRHAGTNAAPYEMIEVRKLTPVVGAEIGNIDLSQPLSDAQFGELNRALAENQVVFFRDQHLTLDQHDAFGRLFGDLHVHPAAPSAPGHPGMMLIHADKDSPRADGEGWHTDVSCDPVPPMGSILYIKTCPPLGGDTLFASMYAAYDSLSDGMKTYLEGLTAQHMGDYRGAYAHHGVSDKDIANPSAVHPVIRVHPMTGRKCLYVNEGFTKRILGVPRDESEGVLNMLYEHMANPLFQCRFQWQANSIAFWDNRCVQHRAMWDYWPATRSGYRVTVRGDKPVGVQAAL